MVLFFNIFDPHHKKSKNNKLHLAFSFTKFGSPMCHAKCHIIYGISGGESSHAFFIHCHCHMAFGMAIGDALRASPTDMSVKKSLLKTPPKMHNLMWHLAWNIGLPNLADEEATCHLFIILEYFMMCPTRMQNRLRGKRHKYNKITNLVHRVEFLL